MVCWSRYAFLSVRALPSILTKFLQAVLAILIGPSAARPGGQSSGAGGYADRLNLQTLTIGLLAFAATAVGSFWEMEFSASPCSPFAGTLCTFHRSEVPLVCQDRRRVQQPVVLPPDCLHLRILDGEGTNFSDCMVESVYDSIFFVRASSLMSKFQHGSLAPPRWYSRRVAQQRSCVGFCSRNHAAASSRDQ